MRDTKLKTTTRNEEFNCNEEVKYNLTKCIAEIVIEVDDEDPESNIFIESEERFQNDMKIINRLAKKEIPKLQEKIKNNKIALHYSQGNQIETDKAKKHLANNETSLEIVKEWLLKNN